jgi:hypothetical protein
MAFTFKPPQAEGAKPVNVLFEGVQFSSEAKLDKGLFSNVSKMSAKGRVDDFAIDKVEMQVSVNRIHAATYQALAGALMKQASSCNKPGDEAAAAQQAAAMSDAMQKSTPSTAWPSNSAARRPNCRTASAPRASPPPMPRRRCRRCLPRRATAPRRSRCSAAGSSRW